MKPAIKATRLFDRIVNYLAAIGADLIVCMMLIVALEVAMRYILGRPQIWVVEVSEYILVWITFLGSTWILRADGHVKVDILFGQFHNRTQALLRFVSSLIGSSVCFVILVWGTKVTWYLLLTWEPDPKSQIGMPKGPLLAVIPACSLPLLIQFIRKGLGHFREWRGQ